MSQPMIATLRMALAAAILCGLPDMGDRALADEADGPVRAQLPTPDDFRPPIVTTDQDAIELGEVYLRLRYGEAELEAQRPLFVLYEGERPDGTAFIAIVGSKTELTDVDFLGVPMRIQMSIGRHDGRLLGIGFYHGVGVPDEAWVPPIASPETGSDGDR